MKYRVILQRLAVQDLGKAYSWVAQYAPKSAARWLERIRAALQTLDTNPHRCPLAKENAKVEFKLREFHVGKKPNVLRAIFTIDGDDVRVLRIRRAQRRWLTRRQIEEALDR